MTIRLNKVTRDLNVGITTAVEFLQKKGFVVEANPNTKITDEQFELLKKEFSTDKDLKMKSERFLQERQTKERNKASVAIEGYETKESVKEKVEEIKTVIPEDVRPKFKPVGKIDLDNLGKKPVVEKEKEVEEQKPEPVVEPVQPKPEVKEMPSEEVEAQVAEKVSEVEPVQETVEEKTVEVPVEEPQTQDVTEEEHHSDETTDVKVEKEEEAPVEETKSADSSEEIFTIRKPEFVSKINVIGQIDLAALNQSTRPKKKSKEEKRKEREEKEKQRLDQRRQMKEAIMKEIRREDSKMRDENDGEGGGKKKRVRINKEKVDINNASSYQKGDHQKGGNTAGQQQGGKKNKDRFKKPVIKQEVSEEDVAKQVKETLARLTSKGKSKGAKYRKEKREQAADRMHELESQEMADSKVLK